MNLNPSKCQEHYINKMKNKNPMILSTDAEKLFSKKKIIHFFMISALNKFNIGKARCNIIKAIWQMCS